jgi:hypothetical protein
MAGRETCWVTTGGVLNVGVSRKKKMDESVKEDSLFALVIKP